MTNTNQNQPPNPSDKKLELINKARDVLRGYRNFNSAQLKGLCAELEHQSQFAYATEVLLVKMKMDEDNGLPLSLRDYQKLSLYIYKDHSLPSSFKFGKALQELQNHDDLSTTLNCETLGLTGAIYKRKWQFDHQFKNLILSKHYYQRGYLSWQQYLAGVPSANDIRNDDGYTAINYAYVNELMAIDELEELGSKTGVSPAIIASLLEAENVRKFILAQFINDIEANSPTLKQDKYPDWVFATVAEAFFGLRKYKQAAIFISKYLQLSGIRPWEIKTFNQQFFSMAYLQQSQKNMVAKLSGYEQTGLEDLKRIAGEINPGSIYECIELFKPEKNKGDNDLMPQIKKGGKLGLALSGGGFRASLFHIGVLAALAEKDELKNIEVLSCVSGGSIIGAYYYIKLKKLLEEKTDAEINQGDYIKLVQEIEKDFLKGVQKNLRVRIFTNLSCNIKMLLNKKYSRTHRLGELYEEHLYKQIMPDKKNIYINELLINPKDKPIGFDIANDNWLRNNKVPQLILNATSVNTGHNWQFTASWMGEPPANIQSNIDVKPRLRRMYYQEAPDAYKNFRLGFAVGASSCVPVMFEPMPMYGLYPGIDLQLIDGGLHDNQGIAALIEEECKNMIISDASGQLPTNKVSTVNEAAVFYRADNILQERLRELQFMDLKERNDTLQLNQLIKMHLKNGLDENPVSWVNCIDPPRTIVSASANPSNNDLLKFGLLRSVQTWLSEIRTDLDAFNDTEAYALMYSGYMQTKYEWSRQNEQSAAQAPMCKWDFLAIKDYATFPSKAEKIKKVLTCGSNLFFKIVKLNKAVKALAILSLIAAAISLAVLIILFWDSELVRMSVKSLVALVAFFYLGKLIKGIGFLTNRTKEIRKWLLFFGAVILGTLLSWLYIIFLNPLYQRMGRIKKKKLNFNNNFNENYFNDSMNGNTE